MDSLHLSVFGEIHRGVGNGSRRGTLHRIDVHVVAGLSGGGAAGRNRRHYVQGRHSLHGISGHVEIIGINGILGFAGVGDLIHFFRVIPLGVRGGNGCARGPVNLVDIDVDTRRAPKGACADAHGNRAAEFRRVGIVRCVHGDVAAFVIFIDLGIQHFSRGRAADIVQVDNTGHFHSGAAGAHSHADIAHVGSNGMGARSIHHHAGLILFITARLQLACRPGIGGYCSVNQVIVVVIICFIPVFHFTLGLDLVAIAAISYHLTVLNQGRSIAGELVVGAGYTNGDSRVGRARYAYVHHAGVVTDGLIALGHHAHVAGALYIRVHDLGRNIVLNKVMATGAAKSDGGVGADGGTDTNAENTAAGSRVSAQVAHVHGIGISISISIGIYISRASCAGVTSGCSGRPFFRIGHSCHGVVFDAVHAHRHHAGQGGFIASGGNFKSCRRRGQAGGSGSLQIHQCVLVFVLVNGSILHARRIVLVDPGVCSRALGTEGGLLCIAHTYGYRGGRGIVRGGSRNRRTRSRNSFADCRARLHCRNIRVVNFRPQALLAVPGIVIRGIAFRQGHGDADAGFAALGVYGGGAGHGGLLGIVRSRYRYGFGIGNLVFRCPVIIIAVAVCLCSLYPMVAVLVLADDRHGIVVAPVQGDVALHREGGVGLGR